MVLDRYSSDDPFVHAGLHSTEPAIAKKYPQAFKRLITERASRIVR